MLWQEHSGTGFDAQWPVELVSVNGHLVTFSHIVEDLTIKTSTHTHTTPRFLGTSQEIG